MAVIAQFKVGSVQLVTAGGWDEAHPPYISRTVNMQAVKGEPFGSATPQGSIQMVIANQAAAEQFELDAVYEVTFKKVSDGKPVKLS